ncbi:MAG: hypothetical protein NTX65_11725 [Ignavibacteriales bacterium]|nr:hypothetical protein [Ignavibacteriales bacterium]
MFKQIISGITYKLPNHLNDFQLGMYVHLINWKWKYITPSPGVNKHKGKLIEYDAILPASVTSSYPIIYPSVLSKFLSHYLKYPFRVHEFFNHMASSQAANVNLFLPILTHSKANEILKMIKSDFDRLAINELDNGFRIEFWDEGFGNLNDKTKVSGTDSDIAIAYYNNENQLCLWLIEHKLTEAEFTECGGYTSEGRKDKVKHNCNKSFLEIIINKNYCYYHDKCRYKYWEITEKHLPFFSNQNAYSSCPFRGGMNQLWRNQILGLSIEDDSNQPAYKHVYFSVVKHPDNHSLDKAITDYKTLVDHNPKFSDYTSVDFINAAATQKDSTLDCWINWYKELYKL